MTTDEAIILLRREMERLAAIPCSSVGVNPDQRHRVLLEAIRRSRLIEALELAINVMDES